MRTSGNSQINGKSRFAKSQAHNFSFHSLPARGSRSRKRVRPMGELCLVKVCRNVIVSGCCEFTEENIQRFLHNQNAMFFAFCFCLMFAYNGG